MKITRTIQLSLLISAATGIGALLFALLLPISAVWRVAFALACFFISLAAVSAMLHFFLVSRIARLNSSIYEALRSSRQRHKHHMAGELGIARLETAVKRLIREKTIEIDNLKELERYRREFLGDVAHELRSPIFNIQGYLHTLLDGAYDDKEVSLKFLEKAARNVDHLSSLVEDLVTISRIETGEVRLELTAFDMAELAQEVIDLQSLAAKNRNIALQLKNESSQTLVEADRGKIKQVLVNLVSNSIKYGREGGHTAISLKDQPEGLLIEVADNGEGIAKEHLPRIFERFYRADKSRSRYASTSTGLGLAIVKHLVEAHKQRISVTSREGIGSIFSFHLEKAKG